MVIASKLGVLTIANGQTLSNVLSHPTMRLAVRLIFYCGDASFTGTVTVQGGYAQAGTVKDVYVNGVKAQVFANGVTIVEAGGFNNVSLISSGAEGGNRTIEVYGDLNLS